MQVKLTKNISNSLKLSKQDFRKHESSPQLTFDSIEKSDNAFVYGDIVLID